MKKENGITMVSLIVTIIVLIILAGISINLILGDNGIITIAKKTKENTELAKIEEETQLNELYTQLETKYANREIIEGTATTSATAFIDTENVLSTICSGDHLSECIYTATEDCIIAGSVRTWTSNSIATIYINNIIIYNLGGSSTTYGDYNSIYQPLKRGQTFKITFNSNDNGTNYIKAYKILY